LFIMMSSTRRFLALFAGLSLGKRGCASPNPCGRKSDCGKMPREPDAVARFNCFVDVSAQAECLAGTLEARVGIGAIWRSIVSHGRLRGTM
jgi:hypothetical protein